MRIRNIDDAEQYQLRNDTPPHDEYEWHFECTHCKADFRLHFDASADACPACTKGWLAE